MSISGFRATLSGTEDLETTHGFTNGELARRVKVQACDKMLHSYQKDKGRQIVKWEKKKKKTEAGLYKPSICTQQIRANTQQPFYSYFSPFPLPRKTLFSPRKNPAHPPASSDDARGWLLRGSSRTLYKPAPRLPLRSLTAFTALTTT